MTLKQFLQLGGGTLVALIIYSTGLHPIIKWPLIVFFALFGAALAFLPFEERPLEQWVIAFFRSIYSPTLFHWKKTTTSPVYFQAEEAGVPAPAPATPTSTPPSGILSPFVSKLEEAEQGFLSSVSNLFTAVPPIAPTPVASVPATAATLPQELKTPASMPLQVAPQGFKPTVVVEEQPTQKTVVHGYATAVGQTIAGQGPIATVAAQFSPDAAPPTPPSIPNVIVGQVMDPDGKIIEGAILEVLDTAGRPIRALKTNKAGHFMIVTPLSNGKYELISEKEGFMFEPISFDASGSIIPPIAIKAKGREVKVDAQA